jgi:hypothetical protein
VTFVTASFARPSITASRSSGMIVMAGLLGRDRGYPAG